MIKGLRHSLLGAAAAILLASAAGTAHADPISFTWDPNVFGVTGAGIISNAAGATLNDDAFATINNSTGDFTESGYLNFTAFQNALGNSISVPGLGSQYQIYIAFTATGNIPGFTDGGLAAGEDGNITSLSYQLIIDPDGNTTFDTNLADSTDAWTVSGNSDDQVLASGSMVNGTGGVSIGGKTHATAAADVTVNPNLPGADAFFVSPSALDYLFLDLETNFTNTSSEAQVTVGATDTDVKFVNGGGTLDMVVPEPGTLAIFGTALIGLGVIGKRRRKALVEA